jgi:hypothetical protein
MKSIKESVHQLLEDQITRVGLQAQHEVQKAEIIGRRTQTSFTFHSMCDQSVDNIKSMGGANTSGWRGAERVQEVLAHGATDDPQARV